MKKIDRATVQRILDAADIVEVVSDFVSLKRRGANYIGLCPFHNERTPSFSVSKSKGICKCFSCGKGGSPINFIMELEQLTYGEALRYLAKKYNIEIQEHEMTAEEREAATERESMFAVNNFALNHFVHNLNETQDGREIGKAYFLERGINEASMKRFNLGYALDRSDDLYKAATAKGFSEKFLVSTGLCSKSERGIYDRFKGRVIYPVMTLSGKVVAFGGRTLRSDKNIAKYVNSPESIIYRKSYELYGLYQARQAIVKQDKCILVEGYMDVISMHQSGIENVVASSGTSLTDGQIRLIHRFTNNVTVIYDADAAGIKASLRGIDLLLAEGLDIKVMLLPEGEDPDSFAQSHSTEEVLSYIDEHETDFIKFKTEILLRGTKNDPIKRAGVITDILRSIAVIPDPIKRQVYVEECSRALSMDDKVLALQLTKVIAANNEKKEYHTHVETETANLTDLEIDIKETPAGNIAPEDTPVIVSEDANAVRRRQYLYGFEKSLVRYILKYGMLFLCDAVDDDGETHPMNVYQYINSELRADNIIFSNQIFSYALEKVAKVTENWENDYAAFNLKLTEHRKGLIQKGIEQIRLEAKDLSDIKVRETKLEEAVESQIQTYTKDYCCSYIYRALLSDPDGDIRALTTELVSDRYQLSKVHTKYSHVETEEEKLLELVPRAIYELKDALLTCSIEEKRQEIKALAQDSDRNSIETLMSELVALTQLKSEFARYLGERIITPRIKH